MVEEWTRLKKKHNTYSKIAAQHSQHGVGVFYKVFLLWLVLEGRKGHMHV